MKSLKKKRRIQVIFLSAGALALATALIGYGFRDGINIYRAPAEVVAAPPAPDEYFQLGGIVEEGSIVDRAGVAFDFVITDGGAVIPVSYGGSDPRPDLFTEGTGTIAKGYYDGRVFQADHLLAKHDETYMPREVVNSLKEQGVFRPSE